MSADPTTRPMLPPQMAVESSATEKHKRYYNSKKDDPGFRAKNAERARNYRKRKAEEKKEGEERVEEKGEGEETDETKGKIKRKRIASLATTDPEILELSRPDHSNPHSPPIEPFVLPLVFNDLHNLRVFTANWSKDYGPIASWPHTLQELHEAAVENDEEEEWCGELKEKVREGLAALYGLKGLFLELPTKKPWMIRDLWCQAFELSGEIHRGIACLQAHLAIYED